jgi:hypothetical protein
MRKQLMNREHDTLSDAHIRSVWEEPVVCRVEVDLAGWLEQLTGRSDWELLDEEEEENYISFAMRQGLQEAEVTLYHNGYAVVDVDGKAVFDGSLTTGTSKCAHLSYYNAESGEPITLN